MVLKSERNLSTLKQSQSVIRCYYVNLPKNNNANTNTNNNNNDNNDYNNTNNNHNNNNNYVTTATTNNNNTNDNNNKSHDDTYFTRNYNNKTNKIQLPPTIILFQWLIFHAVFLIVTLTNIHGTVFTRYMFLIHIT